jgi:hypothetical protein
VTSSKRSKAKSSEKDKTGSAVRTLAAIPDVFLASAYRREVNASDWAQSAPARQLLSCRLRRLNPIRMLPSYIPALRLSGTGIAVTVGRGASSKKLDHR